MRSLNERWEEFLLLFEKDEIDCLILPKIGVIELSLSNQILANFKYFYQKSENSWDGFLMVFKTSLSVVHVKLYIHK
jgi:hypothetical protein